LAITFSASASYGNGGKQFVARITGRDKKFTFRREFIGRKGGKRNESAEALVDDPGLYEVRDIDNKGRPDDSYFVVLEADGELRKSIALSAEYVMPIARRLDAGEDIGRIVEMSERPSRRDPSRMVWDVEIVTPWQAEAKVVAQTIDTAVEACWQILQSFPEKEAKKVLAQLKIRVSPPKPAPAAGMDDAAPAGIVSDASQEAGVLPDTLG
jgi:hypothetical protein